jgi:predicted DNA-binding transcriptional regulator YafY
MQISRLFEIVYILMDKKIVTANSLAEHFEVSKRTILRDIDTLATAGIPVYTMQGKGGGIAIQDRFILNKAVISQEEQQQILFALQGVAATRHIEAEGILSRLRSLFDKAGRDWIEVDFSRWGNCASDRAKFDTLKTAIINERMIAFA